MKTPFTEVLRCRLIVEADGRSSWIDPGDPRSPRWPAPAASKGAMLQDLNMVEIAVGELVFVAVGVMVVAAAFPNPPLVAISPDEDALLDPRDWGSTEGSR